MSEPTGEQPFDPYRFGAPEHPVPPEFAPPGYEKTGYQPPAPPAAEPAPTGTPYAPPAGPPAAYPPPPPGYGPGYSPYGAYGQGPSYPPPGYHVYPQPHGSNGKAVAGLVLGILSCVLCFATLFDLLLIVPGLVLSILGISQARATGVGRSMARWGLGLTIAGALLAAIVGLLLIVLIKNVDCSVSHPSGSFDSSFCSSKGS
jgi:hypothetical protein